MRVSALYIFLVKVIERYLGLVFAVVLGVICAGVPATAQVVRPMPPVLEKFENFNCAEAKDRCVGSGEEYQEIQSAVDAAQPGDTIWIRGDIYEHSQSDSDRILNWRKKTANLLLPW